MSLCYICSGDSLGNFEYFIDLENMYWVISDTHGSIQLSGADLKSFLEKRNHLAG